jgi:hypothetical protein
VGFKGIDDSLLGHESAVTFYRNSAVEYLLGVAGIDMSLVNIHERVLIISGSRTRVVIGVLAGLAGWIVLALIGLFLLHTGWAAYAAAEQTKTYTFAMLLSRLTISVACSVVSGFVAVVTAKSNWRAGWWLGALLLLASVPIHLFSVWADYPVWYHVAYLLPLMPITGFGGHLAVIFSTAKTRRAQQTLAADARKPPRG